MRYHLILKLMPVVAMAALGGCATVTRGTTSDIEFKSEPPGALATTSRGENCTAPCMLKIDRKAEFSVTFKLAGYKDQTVFVKTQVAGAGAAGLVGNALVGGVVGVGVDVITGATLEHVPNPVMVTLERDAPAAPASRSSRKRTPPKAAPAPKPVEAKPES